MPLNILPLPRAKSAQAKVSASCTPTGQRGLALLCVIVMMLVMMCGMGTVLKLMFYSKTAETGLTTRESGTDVATACYNEFIAQKNGAMPTGSFTSYTCTNGAVVSSTSTAAPYFLAVTTTTI